MSKILGYIAYEGPSTIDGAPIVVIVNKIHTDSKNDKTGAIVQTFIIRSDIDPVKALQTGDDASVCGQCEHRPKLAKKNGKAPCYVQVAKSVLSVYNAYRRGRYVKADPATIAAALAGKIVRIGTYGDGAAAPVSLWQTLTQYTADHVGYTHQWQRAGFDHFGWSSLVMASADTAEQALEAQALSYRTFRVSIGLDKRAGEISCPASAESGKKTTCDNCMLCAGQMKSAKNIVIADHALGHKRRVIPILVAA
jgi:hypothetical protein